MSAVFLVCNGFGKINVVCPHLSIFIVMKEEKRIDLWVLVTISVLVALYALYVICGVYAYEYIYRNSSDFKGLSISSGLFDDIKLRYALVLLVAVAVLRVCLSQLKPSKAVAPKYNWHCHICSEQNNAGDLICKKCENPANLASSDILKLKAEHEKE